MREELAAVVGRISENIVLRRAYSMSVDSGAVGVYAHRADSFGECLLLSRLAA